MSNTSDCLNSTWRYSGSNCEIDNLSTYSHIHILVLTIQILSFVSSLYVILYTVFGIYFKMYKRRDNPFKLAYLVSYIYLIAMVIKIVAWVDPFGFYQIFEYNLFIFLYFSYLYLATIGSILAIACWCDLVISFKDLSGTEDFRIPITITTVVSLVGIFILVLCMILTLSSPSTWGAVRFILNLGLGVFGIFDLVMIAIYLNKITKIAEFLRGSRKLDTLKRMNRGFMIIFISLTTLLGFTLLAAVVFYTDQHLTVEGITASIIIQLVMRIPEFVIFSLVLFLVFDWIPGYTPTGSTTTVSSTNKKSKKTTTKTGSE
eukprot:TRINITY_DN660_c0_g1_i1.p1 TRINITY_DN660_c0_g1~~TRINITY_DN660_c0_g1_i1.p1  ORF type:complete len:332 (-),score=9.18 TRINITY_DN660_c0_g1_i1:55-1005(-)